MAKLEWSALNQFGKDTLCLRKKQAVKYLEIRTDGSPLQYLEITKEDLDTLFAAIQQTFGNKWQLMELTTANQVEENQYQKKLAEQIEPFYRASKSVE